MNPRQVKSGVLRDKSIRDETADTTGIFNSVSGSIGLSDQDLRILRRQLGQAKWNKNMFLFFKSYLVNSKTHLFFFGGIFDELEITNDTKIIYPTKTGASLSISLNWKMIRKLYQDRQLSSICTLSKWLLLISPKKKIFYCYLKPRQFESGVLRFESIRKLTVDKTAIFNSVSVGIGPNDLLLRRLQRQLDKQIGRKLCNCLSNLFGSTQHIHRYLLCFREEYFWRNREIKRHQNAFKLPKLDTQRPSA